eukprot:CAMPEP_0119528848 /NCGR_PEP_ID=MMETSP1344-20130328/42947_1 /TAXON_ID=236787 /ORGANISM="Florenciella parvula, Strain CCMP2471" /LENGTH=44 /DNA_ID= /DNA_START= /DNA_END= /DNA_ORIENTATION=
MSPSYLVAIAKIGAGSVASDETIHSLGGEGDGSPARVAASHDAL